MKKILLSSVSLSFLVLVLLVLGNYTDGLVEKISKISVLFLIGTELISVIRVIVQRSKRLKENNFPLNCVFSVSTFFLLLLSLEVIFIFIPRSHGVGYTKGSRNWFKYYWKENSFGFRDVEPITSSKSILFVGDSFTAGHGIKDTKDRFSDIVDQQLSDYNSINIGVCGADTKGEFAYMTEFINMTNIKPNTIVLQYFANDIDIVALDNGVYFGGMRPYQNLNSYFAFIVKGSHLINFVYWFLPQTDVHSYIDFLLESYKNETVYKEHLEDLNKFITYSTQEQIKLIVVVFPIMTNLSLGDDIYVNKISRFFTNNNIETINVSSLIRKNEIERLVVNNNDPHASEEVNAVVADEIVKLIGKIN